MIQAKINLRAHLSAMGVDEILRRVIAHLADSAKYIAYRMGEANRKLAGSMNVYGEEQLELDVMSDEILMERLNQETSFGIQEFASEEQDTIRALNTTGGLYSVVVDPLDGSSLVDVNLAVGTIVGIHEGPILSGRPGKESLVAAMYILYGPLTTLVYTSIDDSRESVGVHEFVMDPTGNFVLAEERIQMKKRGAIYSPGGLKRKWSPEHAAYIEALEKDSYKLRYSGGLVPDANHILMKRGGVFTYPALTDEPEGKLRLLTELQPMAMIFTEAGGGATTGAENILDIVLTAHDQRAPCYIGSKEEVARANEFISGETRT